MEMRNVKLIVWHKIEKKKYRVLKIDWNSGMVELIRKTGKTTTTKVYNESIDSVVLAEIIFID